MHPSLTRREFVASAAGASLCGWLGRVAAAAPDGLRPKACVRLTMAQPTRKTPEIRLTRKDQKSAA